MHSIRWGAAGLVVLLVATACGSATVTVAERDMAATVAFFGDRVSAATDAVTTTVDDGGATVNLGEGTRLIAPAEAFSEETAVTVQRFDIEASGLGEGSPWLTVVVASTSGDVELGRPVVVEIDAPSEGLRAVQIVDGEVTPVPVTGDDRAQVEIRHFSDVVTMFGAGLDVETASSSLDDRQADAEFLSICSLSIAAMLGLFVDVDPEERGFALDRALSFCTTALVRQTAPPGAAVSTRCVGDAVAAGLDFRPAVASCVGAPETTADEAAEADADPVPAPSPASVAVAQSGLADSGLTSWIDTIEPSPDAPQTVTLVDPPNEARVFPYVLGDALVEITRTSGTDEFSITVEATKESASKYALSSEALQALLDADVIDSFEPNYCRTMTNVTFVGQGTFQDTEPSDRYAIIFDGIQESVELRDCELEDLEPFESSLESSLWVEVTEAGLVVQFNEYLGTLAGPATPIAD